MALTAPTSGDARQRRTRAALHAAVLELASRQDPTTISITALADAAGVHRSTVYEHGATVIEVLKSALAVELDALRDTHLREIAPGQVANAVREVTLGVFEHATRHAAVYQRLDTSAGASLHMFLSEHFQNSIRLMLSEGAMSFPFTAQEMSTEAMTDVVVRYLADGAVGLVAGLLAQGEARNLEDVLALFTHVLPPWFPGSE